MIASLRPPQMLRHLLVACIIAVVPLASFLAFLIQPMLGKHLLPIFGGSAGTWLGTMLYFQISLLAGYAWAAWLVRRAPAFQLGCTAFLGLLAIVTFHLPSRALEAEGGIFSIVAHLGLSSFPAMVLLFSVSPLTHAWMKRRGHEVPYFLYAISNTGSLAALLLYPFLIETRLRISDQSFYWHGFLVIVAALLASAGLIHRLASQVETDRPAADALPSETLDLGKAALWLGLSAVSCIGMLGATHHLAAEIGSSPLAWIGPFGAYLFSFTITFSGHWRPWMTRVIVAWLVISLTGFMLVKGFTAATVNGSRALWLLSLTASGSFLGNALLHTLRPAVRFERYYLILAAGGVLGGLCSSLVIPFIFSRPMEFVFASVVLLVTGIVWLVRRHDVPSVFITALIVAVPVIGLGWNQIHQEEGGARFVHLRNLYAHTFVRIDDQAVVLSNETTTHGSQFTTDAETRARPTLYYTESTAAGRIIQKLQADRPSINVGVVGLGAGTLAAYARKSDAFDFWDIDPQVVQISDKYFSYLRDSAGTIRTHRRDGRKGIDASRGSFDLIIVDAFSGDGIPPHLVTREAMKIYSERLRERSGILLIHASTRYSRDKLFPVLATTARTLGLSAINISTEISGSAEKADWDPTPTQYVAICTPDRASLVAGWFASEEDGARVKQTVTIDRSNQLYFDLIWSDERNAAIDAFDIGRFMMDQ